MIDLWWMLFPMFVMWVQYRIIIEIKKKMTTLYDDLVAEKKEHTKVLKKLLGATTEIGAIYHDIADSTKVSNPYGFIAMRAQKRKEAKRKEKL